MWQFTFQNVCHCLFCTLYTLILTDLPKHAAVQRQYKGNATDISTRASIYWVCPTPKSNDTHALIFLPQRIISSPIS
jgi:hypothetical protein